VISSLFYFLIALSAKQLYVVALLEMVTTERKPVASPVANGVAKTTSPKKVITKWYQLKMETTISWCHSYRLIWSNVGQFAQFEIE